MEHVNIMDPNPVPKQKRKRYRSGRKETAVRVYTVADESKYLVVSNVPALGVIEDLLKLFALYGPIEEYRMLDDYPTEEFTDVYWIRFADINNARHAKRKLDDYRFFGASLVVAYAPEFESVAETREKLNERRRAISKRLNPNWAKREVDQSGESSAPALSLSDAHVVASPWIPDQHEPTPFEALPPPVTTTHMPTLAGPSHPPKMIARGAGSVPHRPQPPPPTQPQAASTTSAGPPAAQSPAVPPEIPGLTFSMAKTTSSIRDVLSKTSPLVSVAPGQPTQQRQPPKKHTDSNRDPTKVDLSSKYVPPGATPRGAFETQRELEGGVVEDRYGTLEMSAKTEKTSQPTASVGPSQERKEVPKRRRI